MLASEFLSTATVRILRHAPRMKFQSSRTNRQTLGDFGPQTKRRLYLHIQAVSTFERLPTAGVSCTLNTPIALVFSKRKDSQCIRSCWLGSGLFHIEEVIYSYLESKA